MHRTQERRRKLTAYLDTFSDPAFTFATTTEATQDAEGFWMPPYTFMTDQASAFVKECYEGGWVVMGLDWASFFQSPKAIAMRDDPCAMALASEDAIAAMLTGLVRQERFCNGSLNDAYQSGLIVALLSRLEQIDREESNNSSSASA